MFIIIICEEIQINHSFQFQQIFFNALIEKIIKLFTNL